MIIKIVIVLNSKKSHSTYHVLFNKSCSKMRLEVIHQSFPGCIYTRRRER
jgi:hypothetical protein